LISPILVGIKLDNAELFLFQERSRQDTSYSGRDPGWIFLVPGGIQAGIVLPGGIQAG
jgi:hypothetical protein